MAEHGRRWVVQDRFGNEIYNNRKASRSPIGRIDRVQVMIVSNRKGNELGDKLLDYARAGVGYYVVFDPLEALGEERLRVFARRVNSFVDIGERWLPEVELGLTLWEGPFENWPPTLWLRWVDKEGALIPTGAEQLDEERRQREELLAKLRERGIDPETL